jgi:uncharacterized damage-inducible protein DinB
MNPALPYQEAFAPKTTPIEALERAQQETSVLLSAIAPAQLVYAYAPGKWTVAQVIRHVLDAERVFAYRALCIARGEQQSLPGFNEDAYAAATARVEYNIVLLRNEASALQASTLALYRSFTPEDLARTGTANGQPRTPQQLAYLIAGHTLHHLFVLRERYG